MRTEIIGSNVSSALGWRISYSTGRLSLDIKEEKECPSLLPTNSLPPELLGPSNKLRISRWKQKSTYRIQKIQKSGFKYFLNSSPPSNQIQSVIYHPNQIVSTTTFLMPSDLTPPNSYPMYSACSTWSLQGLLWLSNCFCSFYLSM